MREGGSGKKKCLCLCSSEFSPRHAAILVLALGRNLIRCRPGRLSSGGNPSRLPEAATVTEDGKRTERISSSLLLGESRLPSTHHLPASYARRCSIDRVASYSTIRMFIARLNTFMFPCSFRVGE